MKRSQGRFKEQIQDTVREIPVQAARLALFGVGRTLLLTDRVRKDYHEAREAGLRPVLQRWREDAGQLAGKVKGRVSERMPAPGGRPDPQPAPETKPASEPKPAPGPKPAPEPPAAEPTKTAEPIAKPAPETDAVPEPVPAPTSTPDRVTKLTAESLPVPDYDDATLASVRARLRTLNAVQVSQLRDYEHGHKARADFLRMYENRIAKLTEGR